MKHEGAIRYFSALYVGISKKKVKGNFPDYEER